MSAHSCWSWVLTISCKAQRQLYRTWQRLDNERGKRRTLVAAAVAVACEFLGFCRAITRAE